MAINFKNLLNDALTNNSSSSMGFQSLSEYLKSMISKFEQIVSGKSNMQQYVAIPVYATISGVQKQVVANFNADDIKDAIDGNIETIDGILNDAHDIVSVEVDEFLSQFQNEVAQAQIQSEFIDTCLSTAETNAQTFAASIAAKYKAVSGLLVKQYADLLNTGDKLYALKSWISQIKTSSVTNNNDQYIELIQRDNYTGVNVWNVVIDDFLSSITSFFENVWQGILDMQGFFERLWNGIVSLGQFIISKSFRYLSSNLTAGEAKFGLLDYPIFCVKLGQLIKSDNRFVSFSISNVISSSYSKVRTHLINSDFYIKDIDGNTFNAGQNQLSIEIFQHEILFKLLKETIVTKVYDPETGLLDFEIVKAFDTTLTGPEWNDIDGWTIRLGCDSNYNVYISLYANLRQGCLDAYSDPEILGMISNALYSLINTTLYQQYHYPVKTVRGSSMPAYFDFLDTTLLVSNIINNPGLSGQVPVDFATSFKFLNDSDITNASTVQGNITYGDSLIWLIMFGFIPYTCMMSPLSEADYFSAVESNVRYLARTYGSWQSQLSDVWSNSADYPSVCEIPLNWPTAYKPYLSYSNVPSSIHLQTITERAKEVEYTIIAVLIAAAVIAISIKLFKFRRNLAIKTELANFEMERLAYSDEFDPSSPTDVANYRKLRKKARWLERFAGLFGTASTITAQSAAATLTDTVFDRVNANSKAAKASETSNTNTIVNKVNQVKTAITGQ